MSRRPSAGKIALVTGGGTRVGAAISRALADAGCDLVVHFGKSRAGAEAVRDHAVGLGRRVALVSADLRDREELARVAEETRAFCQGKLDVLVNNAGNFERVPPEDLDARAWDDALALNATAPYLLTLALRDDLRRARGAMIAIGCISAERPWKSYVPYSVSKAALVHLVRGLALALAPDVRVNAVSPGTVMLPEAYDEAAAERIRSRIPLARLGEADDIARAVVFLSENDFVTGQVLAVDGGRSIAD